MEGVVGASVEGKFASLAEGFLASGYSADEGLLAGVGVLVLLQILRQSESLRTE